MIHFLSFGYQLCVVIALQLFNSFDNNSTIVQGKQKYRPINCIYVIYVTIRIRHRFLDIFTILHHYMSFRYV